MNTDHALYLVLGWGGASLLLAAELAALWLRARRVGLSAGSGLGSGSRDEEDPS